MTSTHVGISDIGFYVPSSRIELGTILARRALEDPSFERRLRKAIESTGQKAIRFPAYWEDSASLAGNALLDLLSRSDSQTLSGLRFLASGTESSVDFSKPVSSYVQGMLIKAGFTLPPTLSSFQVQHACAGGTIALLSVAAQLAISRNTNESGIVTCSDIARYETPSTAEITQGAGAIALLVEQNPKLLEIDLSTQGYASGDVDDFFRPLDSVTARVRGQYSMQCYNDAANHAFQDHCQRSGKTPVEVLSETDWFVFHVPFARMAYTAARSLLTQHLRLLDGEVDEYLAPRGFFDALEATAQVGNIYTGAAYLNLASLLSSRRKLLGDDIEGKKILFSSYGSGNTMLVFRATVAKGAGAIIDRWNLDKKLSTYEDASFETYQSWISRDWSNYNQKTAGITVPSRHFHLSGIREDGYRVYDFQT